MSGAQRAICASNNQLLRRSAQRRTLWLASSGVASLVTRYSTTRPAGAIHMQTSVYSAQARLNELQDVKVHGRYGHVAIGPADMGTRAEQEIFLSVIDGYSTDRDNTLVEETGSMLSARHDRTMTRVAYLAGAAAAAIPAAGCWLLAANCGDGGEAASAPCCRIKKKC